MNHKYPLAPAAVTSLVTLCLTFIIGTVLLLCWSLVTANEMATPIQIWHYIWHQGIALPSCGYDLSCRFSHIYAVINYPQILLRLKLLSGACLVSALISFLMMHLNSPWREALRTVRGRKIQYDGDARRSLRKRIQKTGVTTPNALWLMPFVQLTSEAETYNISLLGDQGAGKTGVLRGWAEQVINRGDRCVLHDAKGDLTACLPIENFMLLAPSDARGWMWEIGRDVINTADAREVAIKLVPKNTTGEAMWADSARALLIGIIGALQKKHGIKWDWSHLFQAVFLAPRELHMMLREAGSPAESLLFTDGNDELGRTSQSILLTLWVSALTNIWPLAEAANMTDADKRFSIRDWLAPNSTLPKIIVLQYAADYAELSSAVSGLFIDALAGKILASSAPNRKEPWVYFILDELPVLRHLEHLPMLLSVGREKGVRCIASTQNWEQIIKIYGPQDAATLEARFKIKIVCQLGISETQKRVIQEFGGTRDIVEWEDAGKGNPKIRRVRTVNVIEQRLLSDDLGVIGQTKNLRVRLAIIGLGDIAIVDIPFTAWTESRPARVPISSI